MLDLAQLDKEYSLSHLEKSDLHPNPFQQFEIWLEEAIASNAMEANAMSLATVDNMGHVSVRMVLCKSVDEHGFIFFTNYNSPKSQALLEHPQAAIQFWWPTLERQVRIEGVTQKLDPIDSDTYFAQRDQESQLTSIISKQSQIMPDKQGFINEYEALKNKQPTGQPFTRPDYWGGFILKPTKFEFWQGGLHRLSDRLCYQKSNTQEDIWEIVRLYP